MGELRLDETGEGLFGYAFLDMSGGVDEYGLHARQQRMGHTLDVDVELPGEHRREAEWVLRRRRSKR